VGALSEAQKHLLQMELSKARDTERNAARSLLEAVGGQLEFQGAAGKALVVTFPERPDGVQFTIGRMQKKVYWDDEGGSVNGTYRFFGETPKFTVFCIDCPQHTKEGKYWFFIFQVKQKTGQLAPNMWYLGLFRQLSASIDNAVFIAARNLYDDEKIIWQDEYVRTSLDTDMEKELVPGFYDDPPVVLWQCPVDENQPSIPPEGPWAAYAKQEGDTQERFIMCDLASAAPSVQVVAAEEVFLSPEEIELRDNAPMARFLDLGTENIQGKSMYRRVKTIEWDGRKGVPPEKQAEVDALEIPEGFTFSMCVHEIIDTKDMRCNFCMRNDGCSATEAWLASAHFDMYSEKRQMWLPCKWCGLGTYHTGDLAPEGCDWGFPFGGNVDSGITQLKQALEQTRDSPAFYDDSSNDDIDSNDACSAAAYEEEDV